MGKPASFANTMSTQWFERTLDDSAIRREFAPGIKGQDPQEAHASGLFQAHS